MKITFLNKTSIGGRLTIREFDTLKAAKRNGYKAPDNSCFDHENTKDATERYPVVVTEQYEDTFKDDRGCLHLIGVAMREHKFTGGRIVLGGNLNLICFA